MPECQVVVLEVGLGGRLDATNIVTPEVSVITNISLEHQRILGDTLSKIAGEKAGVLKPGVPLYRWRPSEERTARTSASRKGGRERRSDGSTRTSSRIGTTAPCRCG